MKFEEWRARQGDVPAENLVRQAWDASRTNLVGDLVKLAIDRIATLARAGKACQNCKGSGRVRSGPIPERAQGYLEGTCYRCGGTGKRKN